MYEEEKVLFLQEMEWSLYHRHRNARKRPFIVGHPSHITGYAPSMPSQGLIGRQIICCQVVLNLHGVFIPRTSAVNGYFHGDVAELTAMNFQSVGHLEVVIEVGQRVICPRF